MYYFIKKELPNIKKAVRCLLAALPGGLLYYDTKNSAWFSIALVSVACCIPYGSKQYNIYSMLILCLTYDLLFSIQTYALHFPLLYAAVIFTIGFFYVYSTRNNPNLRQYNTWIFIPSLYNAIEFHDNIFNHVKLYFLERIYFTPIAFICAYVACFIILPNKLSKEKDGIINKLKIRNAMKLFFLNLINDIKYRQHPVFRQALRTSFAVLISFCLVYFFHLKEGQWLIWSSASIMLTKTEDSIKKSINRFLGLFFGIAVGFFLVKIIPQSPALSIFFAFGIFITLSGALQNYALAFGTRCALIMATGASLDGSNNAGIERFENVVLGIIIGILSTLLLWPHKEENKE